MIRLFDKFDILLVEGLKSLPLPRIGVFRDSLDSDYFTYIDALATDGSANLEDYDMPSGIDVLDLNNPDEVILWIFKNAKEV